jgi:hypothetical protein
MGGIRKVFGASFDEERKEHDAGAEYACNEWKPRRSALGS